MSYKYESVKIIVDGLIAYLESNPTHRLDMGVYYKGDICDSNPYNPCKTNTCLGGLIPLIHPTYASQFIGRGGYGYDFHEMVNELPIGDDCVRFLFGEYWDNDIPLAIRRLKLYQKGMPSGLWTDKPDWESLESYTDAEVSRLESIL